MKKRIKLNLGENRAWGKTFSTIPGWDSEKLRAAKVMVVGAGALGNEVIKNLTLLDVGNIFIVDFDIVEFDNLAKSILFRKEDTGAKKAKAIAKNLKNINEGVNTFSVVGDIATDVGLGIFKRMDVVIGCLDNRLARLHINRKCHKVNKSWVDGALENLSGRFNVYTPGVSCFECNLTDAARDIIEFRMGCPDIAKRNASMGIIATTPISSSVIGAFQVQEALKIIFGNTDQSIAGEEFQYNGNNNFFYKFRESDLKEDCESHVFYDPIIESAELSHDLTVKELLDWLENHFDTSEVGVLVEEDIVLEVASSSSNQIIPTAIYKNHLHDSEILDALELEMGEEVYIPKSTNTIDRNFPFPNKTLKEIGIPFLDILKVETEDDIHFVELTGDEKKLTFN